jgi:AcrR family transcriptional regulator
MFKDNFRIEVNSSLFIKNPTSSKLGESIVKEGLSLLENIGYEDFTFKKLAISIQTTESTLYRYFENKHQFLMYLFNYYWTWMEVNFTMAITNISDPQEQLKRIIGVLVTQAPQKIGSLLLDEFLLKQVITNESSKTFLNKKVDEENKAGYYLTFKRNVCLISEVLLKMNPNYLYPNALAATLIEASFHQRYFGLHLPRLTNELHVTSNLEDFLFHLSINALV